MTRHSSGTRVSCVWGVGDESVRFFKVFPPVSRQRDIRRAQRDRVNLSVR